MSKYLIKFHNILNTQYIYHSDIFVSFSHYHHFNITDYIINNKMDIKTKISFLLQICSGIADLHSSYIVHGDIKPSNILITDDTNEVMISDPFISELYPTNYHLFSIFKFPEIYYLQSDCYEYKYDIWSLGYIIYYIITEKYLIEREEDNTYKLLLLDFIKHKNENNYECKLNIIIQEKINSLNYPFNKIMKNILTLDDSKRKTIYEIANEIVEIDKLINNKQYLYDLIQNSSIYLFFKYIL